MREARVEKQEDGTVVVSGLVDFDNATAVGDVIKIISRQHPGWRTIGRPQKVGRGMVQRVTRTFTKEEFESRREALAEDLDARIEELRQNLAESSEGTRSDVRTIRILMRNYESVAREYIAFGGRPLALTEILQEFSPKKGRALA